MQDGTTPAILASRKGHTETLALLLANKANINAANKVQQFLIYYERPFILLVINR
jgi:ankyrin repeat protein